MSLFQIFKTTGLESNIWKFTLILIANKRAFAAILGVYYLTVPDVTIQSVGLIILAGQIAGFIFEIPSGYLSDKFGHKKAIVFSRILMVLSTLFFLLADSLSHLMIAIILWNISQSFLSGTGIAFMHETFRGLGREKDYTEVMGKVTSIGFAVPVILTALIPFMVEVSYKTPFVMVLLLDIIGLLAAIYLIKPHVKPEDVKEIGATNFRAVLKEGHRLGFIKHAVFAGVVAGFIFAFSNFRDIYQAFLGIPVIYFGLLFGAGRVLASVMLAYSGRIKKLFTLTSYYVFQLLLYSGIIFTFVVTDNLWVVAVGFVLINAFMWGTSQVHKGFMLEIISESKFKATLLSLQPQVTAILWGVLGFGLGYLIEKFSYEFGFLYLGIAFVGITVPFYWYIKRSYKK